MKSTFTRFKLMYAVLIVALPQIAQAQFQVTNTANISSAFTPISLISNVFISGGVDIDTIIYTGTAAQVGYFQNGTAVFGIDQGIVMSSGNAEDADNGNTSGQTMTIYGTTSTTSPLTGIATGNINDLCQYEIVFTPTSSNLTFQYVFASEEYPEWVGSTFNDVFGFFISSPGGVGPYTNIARVPGTTTPVSINNVNAGSFAQYYVSNTSGPLEYDGRTTVLTATATVIPCQTYRIILAISDVGDWSYDSAVFLKASSFSTNAIAAIPVTPSPDSVLIEGCSPGQMLFTLNSPPATPVAVTYSVGGTATPGVDYAPIPTSGVIPAGSTQFSFPITVYDDGISEGTEYIQFIINTTPCTVDTVRIYIKDNQLVTGNIDDTFICLGDSLILDATSPSPIPPSYSFTSSPSTPILDFQANTYNINIAGFPFPNITPNMIESICLNINHIWDADLDIFLIAPDGKFLELTTDNGGSGDNYLNTCFTPTATTNITAGTPPFTGNFQPEGPWSFLYGAPVNGTWTLQITDDAFGFSGTLNSFSINFAPIYDISYTWTPTTNLIGGATNPVVIVHPTTTTTYIVNASDTYGCSASDTAVITVGTQLPAPVVACGQSTTNSVTFTWAGIAAATSYLVNVNNTGWVLANGTLSHTVTGLTAGQSVAIQVQAQGGSCTGTPQIGTLTCTSLNCSITSSLDAQTDASCFGTSDGSVTVSAPTGVPPYSYSITTGVTQPTGVFTGLAAGAYTVTISDATGCFLTVPVTINQPAAIQNTLTPTHVSCNGGNNGSISVSSTGGQGTIAYLWSNNQTGASITALTAGTYTVTATDANGCTSVSSSTLTQPTALTSSMASTNITCNGTATGTAVVTIGGGVAPYTYAWSHNPALNSDTASNLVAGTYNVTATDANGCTISASATLTQPTALTLPLSPTDVSCSNANDGSITANVAGGTLPYNFTWNTTPVQNTATASNLSGGTYTVTVVDGNGCTLTNSTTVNELPPIVLSHVSTNLSCNGINDGTIDLTATGGAGGFTYAWNLTLSTNANLTGLAAGTYIATVTDADNCVALDTTVLIEPAVLTVAMSSTNINCFGGNNGVAIATPSGGTAPYSYQWQFNGGALGINNDTLTNRLAGAYAVTVTDANGCTTTGNVTLTEPTALSATTTATNATCSGSGDGSIATTVSGGVAPYAYQWNTVPVQTGTTATNLNPDPYAVTVTDANGCTFVALDTVIVPDPIVLSGVSTSLTCFGANDGTATANITGGTTPYTYLWNTNPAQTDSTATGLQAGTYTVTVTDGNGCFDTFQIVVTGPIILNPILNVINVNCNGGTDGSVIASAVGGTLPYSFNWNTNPVQTTSNASNLAANTYTVTISDANGCLVIDSATVTEPPALAISMTTTPLNCYGDGSGTASVSVSGGTPNYTYLWSSGQNTATATGLMAGVYTVTATDANNCTIVDNVTVTQPDSLTLTMSSTQVSCNGAANGTASVSVIGGTSPYIFAWSSGQNTATATGLNGGTYTVTVTDGNGCFKIDNIAVLEQSAIALSTTTTDATCFGSNNGAGSVVATGGTGTYTYAWNTTPVQNTANAANLTAGNYTVTVTDTDGCSQTASVAINQPDSITLTTLKTDISCFGANDGTIIANATGGTAPYAFAWNTNPPQNLALIGNLAGGVYTVTVTDANGCTNSRSVTIVEPTAITYTTATTGLLCNGDFSGTATVMASGGAGGFLYAWNTTPVQNTATATGLAAGIYYFAVIDANGCSVADSVAVTEPTQLTSSTNTTAVICSGGGNGTATAIPLGGTPPYGFTWNTNPPQTNSTAAGLAGGIYYVLIADANGCLTTDTVEVFEPVLMATTLSATNTSCFGATDGSVSVSVFGGISPFTYNWSPTGSTATSINNIGAGWYTVTVNDSTNCQITDSIEVLEPSEILLSLSATAVVCSGDTNGTATVVPSGGAGNYSYLWNTSPAQTTATATGLSPATYTVTVTDANGCFSVGSVQVTTPNPLTVSLSGVDVDCFGFNTGQIQSSVLGGVPNYTYNWNNGASTPNLANVPAGVYILMVNDANGCSISDTFTINQPSQPLTISVSGTEVNCFGGNNGTATVVANGGTPTYNYLWNTSPAQVGATATNLTAGTYNVLVTDANGCFAVDNILIEQPAAITLLMSQTPSSCYGSTDGTATVAASGGFPNYTFVWNTIPQQVGATATNLMGGQTYTVLATDANGCSTSQSITIGQPAPITLTTTQTNITCNGLSDGSATVFSSGGTPGYTFLWDANANNQPTSQATNLAAGAYVVTVSDFFGCSATTSVLITEPAPLAVNTSVRNVSCKGYSTGAATALFAGGTAPYFVVWDANTGNAQSSIVENLAAGTYFLTLTDANGCQMTDSVTITEPPTGVTTSVATIDATCYDEQDGEIQVTANGGTLPYSFSLDNQNFLATNRLVGLAAGDYIVYTKDGFGCKTSDTVTINEPAEFTVSIPGPIQIQLGQSANLTAITNNGVAPFIFDWDPSSMLSCNPCQSPVADSLQNDTYFRLQAIDANGCIANAIVTVYVTSPRYVFIANGFTPNDDGANDVLFVQGGNGTVKVRDFKVFDRWGELVFETQDAPLNDPSFGWDGKFKDQPVNSGIFAWVVEVEFVDGERIVYKGSTSLIR